MGLQRELYISFATKKWKEGEMEKVFLHEIIILRPAKVCKQKFGLKCKISSF